MEKIEIKINTDSLYTRLARESGLVARSRLALGVSDTVAEIMSLTEDEKEMAGNWIANSINETMHIMNRYLESCSVNINRDNSNHAVEYVISVSIPHNFPHLQSIQLEMCIKELVTSRTLQQWYTTVKPDEANIAITSAQNHAGLLRGILTQRERPKRI